MKRAGVMIGILLVSMFVIPLVVLNNKSDGTTYHRNLQVKDNLDSGVFALQLGTAPT